MTRPEIAALADEYEAGTNKALASGYEEYGPDFKRKRQIVIDALRLYVRLSATLPGDAVREVEAIEWQDVEEDDPDVIVAAHAIAEHGVGRPWHDFEPVSAYDLGQSDLIEYARAAVAALRAKTALAPAEKAGSGWSESDVALFAARMRGMNLMKSLGSGQIENERVAKLLAEFPRAAATPTPPSGDVARQMIDAERARQISEEGWTAAHDDAHDNGELLRAAMCYLSEARLQFNTMRPDGSPLSWPWETKWWKPSTTERNFVKAGALLIAERDRLVRAGRPHSHVDHKIELTIKWLNKLIQSAAHGGGTKGGLSREDALKVAIAKDHAEHGDYELPSDLAQEPGVVARVFVSGAGHHIDWIAKTPPKIGMLLYTHPVSLDREAAIAAFDKVYLAHPQDEGALRAGIDAIVALIEGRT